MGSAIIRAMEKTTAFKYFFPTKTEKVTENTKLLPVEEATAVRFEDVRQKASRSYHSQDDSLSTRLERASCHNSRHSQSLSLSSASSSAMDCYTSKSTDDEGFGAAREVLSREEDCGPSTSTAVADRPTGVRLRKANRPIKGRQELSSSDLHKCQSEPFKVTINTHRTASDQPLPTQADTRSKAYGRVTLEQGPSAKHMEGEQQLSQHKTREHKPPIETGDYHQMARPKACTDSDRPSRVVKGKKKTASPSSTSEVYETSTTGSSSASGAVKPSQESPLNKLLRNMEYVSTIMKKKTYPPIFEANKYAFIDKIFTSSQIQYGYQGDRYIKIGSGEFGDVLYGRENEGRQLVAIKALKKDKTDTFALLQEAFMLQLAGNTGYAAQYRGLAPFSALGNKYLEWAIICDFVGSNDGPTPYDFRQTLKKARCAHRTVQLILDWIFTCTKIAFAVKQFHNMGMLLNDIKADNILLRPTSSGSHDPVFVDFGLASIGEGITLALEVNDTNRDKILKEYSHIAPEVLFGGETNTASDVFSLGKALSLVADAFPVEALLNIISRCTLWNVNERPSLDELINSFHWLSRNVVLNQ